MTKKTPKKAYWIQKSVQEMEKQGTVGALREQLGIKEGKIIPLKILKEAAKEKGILGKRARWALTVRKLSSK